MSESLRGMAWIDRAAIALSGLCLVHCVGTALLIALLATTGGALLDPRIHEGGLALAIILATVGIGRGILRHEMMLPAAIGGLGIGVMMGALGLPHGGGETLYTVLGVALVALGHDLNRRALI